MQNNTISDEQFNGFPRNCLCEKIRSRNKEDQINILQITHLMKSKGIMIFRL
jgi:hypothetical protein